MRYGACDAPCRDERGAAAAAEHVPGGWIVLLAHAPRLPNVPRSIITLTSTHKYKPLTTPCTPQYHFPWSAIFPGIKHSIRSRDQNAPTNLRLQSKTFNLFLLDPQGENQSTFNFLCDSLKAFLYSLLDGKQDSQKH